MTEQTKKRAYRFHNDEPQGRIFNCTEKEFKELEEDGWVNSPAKLDVQVEKEVGVTQEQAESLDPMALVAMVKSLGYEVFTPEMLEAEINKALSVPLDVNTVPDDLIRSEYSRRFGDSVPAPEVAPMSADSEEESTIEGLLEVFAEEPEALIIDELVTLGNVKYKLGLRSNMKEATLIAKIQEAQSTALKGE